MNLFVFIALSSAIFYAISITLKKRVFTQTNIPAYNFSLFETFINVVFGIFLVIVFQIEIIQHHQATIYLILAGIIYGVTLIIYFYALEKDDAERISQLCSLEAVITSVMAIILLNETASTESYIGVTFVILALLLLSIEKNIITVLDNIKTSLIPIGIALILWSLDDILIKISLEFVDFIYAYFWVRIASFVTLSILLSLHPKSRTQTIKIYSDIIDKKMYLFIIASLFSSIGMFLTIIAFSLDNLSLVVPIVSSYSIFVILFVYIEAKLFGNKINSDAPLWKRTISGTMFIIGIILITI